jgi:DNA topoisomerase I
MPRTRRVISPPATVAPIESAKSVGLRYVTDGEPGLRRRRAGRGFSYVDTLGKALRDGAQLRRIRALAIPPAWTAVWICADARGHVQAHGRDARGRKQYRYHAEWRRARDQTKFDRMIAFGRVLPRARERVEHDLGARGLPREKVLACVVRLLETTLIRVGNEEYARSNRTYGLTTLRGHHVTIEGPRMRFAFRGKSGISHVVALSDRRLARIVRQCQELPGQDREITGDDFTAKDFRTWAGTVLAARAFTELHLTGEPATKSSVVSAIKQVSKRLGNTVAVCRKCYVHPHIFDSYYDGSLAVALQRELPANEVEWLEHDEARVLDLLAARLGTPRA